jgi:hypothetical protein
VNAVAPLKLPFVAARSTARAGRKLAGLLALPALGAAAGGVAYRVLHRGRPPAATEPAPEPAPVFSPRTERTAAAPPPTLSVVDTIDPDVGVVPASELPIPSFDELAAKDAARLIRELTDAEEVRTVLRFEQENAKRATVIAAAEARLAVLEP